MTQGNTQYTGRSSDLDIAGDGFFVVNSRGSMLLTRAGSFALDTSGHLVTPDGSVLQNKNGTDVDLSALFNPANNYTSWSVGPNGDVNATDASGTVTTLDTVQIARVDNPQGLARVDGTKFQVTAASGPMVSGTAGSNGNGTITSGYLEASNVDLSQQLTNLIIAERGFQANSRVITTSDEILQTLVNLKN
jgi:flagellar hook protein FlgE